MNEPTANASLDEAMCRQRLAMQHFGRVIVTSGNEIDIVPVAYVRNDVAIALRAVIPQALPVGAACLFEVDAPASAGQDGW